MDFGLDNASEKCVKLALNSEVIVAPKQRIKQAVPTATVSSSSGIVKKSIPTSICRVLPLELFDRQLPISLLDSPMVFVSTDFNLSTSGFLLLSAKVSPLSLLTSAQSASPSKSASTGADVPSDEPPNTAKEKPMSGLYVKVIKRERVPPGHVVVAKHIRSILQLEAWSIVR